MTGLPHSTWRSSQDQAVSAVGLGRDRACYKDLMGNGGGRWLGQPPGTQRAVGQNPDRGDTTSPPIDGQHHTETIETRKTSVTRAFIHSFPGKVLVIKFRRLHVLVLKLKYFYKRMVSENSLCTPGA